jgi:hypothetical protein
MPNLLAVADHMADLKNVFICVDPFTGSVEQGPKFQSLCKELQVDIN